MAEVCFFHSYRTKSDNAIRLLTFCYAGGMCGRYTLVQSEGIKERFDAQNDLKELRPNYNASPGQTMPVVTRHSPNSLELMKWGLVPFWAKEPQIGYKMINARAEGIQDKPSFRAALKSRRCLVPASGFYEWKKEDGAKQPYYIHLSKREVFAFAGLYEIWRDSEGKELKTYTIITTRPNSLMESIHDRMPVILPPDAEAEWLDPDVTNPDQITRLLEPYPTGLMAAYAVSSAVNSPANNRADLLEPTQA